MPEETSMESKPSPDTSNEFLDHDSLREWAVSLGLTGESLGSVVSSLRSYYSQKKKAIQERQREEQKEIEERLRECVRLSKEHESRRSRAEELKVRLEALRSRLANRKSERDLLFVSIRKQRFEKTRELLKGEEDALRDRANQWPLERLRGDYGYARELLNYEKESFEEESNARRAIMARCSDELKII